jgi:hypothetical protein
MKTILAILRKAGGWRPSLYLKIEKPPYIGLVIEAMDECGPLGFPALSVIHISENDGNFKHHPEMRFELEPIFGARFTLNPYYWRHDFIPVEQFSRFVTEREYVRLAEVHERHVRISAEWDATLSRQGTTDAFTDKCILG